MGRRSINTTKSGKYMNPTDQARKEARKKELKKNKKQRQMVRAAVLKGKDPAQILEEMEKIDEMEYNVMQPSPLNEKVLREKRKKLKETFDRVMRLYHNDDPELWADLKRKENEYEKRRLKKQQYYESVKHAQTVQVDEIPLPQLPTGPGTQFPPPGRVPISAALPVPPFISGQPPSILKKPTEKAPPISKPEETPPELKKKEPPGCPPGPPPDLHDMSELDTDAEEDESVPSKRSKAIRFSDESRDNRRSRRNSDDHRSSKSSSQSDSGDVAKPTSLQKRMLAISGQNIDDFMKEMESVQKKRDKDDDDKDEDDDDDRSSNKSSAEDDDEESNDDSVSDSSDSSEPKEPTKVDIPPSIPLPPAPTPAPAPPVAPPALPLPGGPPPPPMGLPPAMLFRPPPLRPSIPGMTIRMPPGPPPGRPGMPGAPGGLPPRLGIRMPPGPPPGLPPTRLMHHHQKNQPTAQVKDSKGVTTITAKPQIRNLSADVTRFVPSTLRVRREDSRRLRPKQPMQEVKKMDSNPGATKDDAYMQFMREMQGLL